MQFSALENSPGEKFDAEARATAKPATVDEAFLSRALDHANLNVLRVALYQHTQDPELAAMTVIKHARPGSPFLFSVLSPEDDAKVRAKAIAYLLGTSDRDLTIPTKAQAGRLMELFTGDPLSTSDHDFGWEELAFDGFPRAAEWSGRPAPEAIAKYNVTIIGSGFSGLIAAIQLERLGIRYRIIERQGGIGGTWFLNDYPDARVDITSFLYQYKFEKSYPWKSYFATQGELRDYVDYIVDKYGLREKIALNTSVTHAEWVPDENMWALAIANADGSRETFRSNFVISASGLFSTPKLPDIPGIEDFEGAMFHSTAWDHGYDYAGKRVAVVGTGSTGSQLVHGVAEKAESLVIYQRTPNWVTGIPGYRNKVEPEKRWLLDHMPGYAQWYGYSHHVSQLQMQAFHRIDRAWQAKGGLINEKNDQLREGLTSFIRKQVGDRDDLFAKLVPDFAPISRRLVVDNGFYKTLVRPNVTLETSGIEHFTAQGIVDNDGVEREFDLVVLCAGFKVSQYLWPVDYIGRNGIRLQDNWGADGARAHMTMTMPGFPNFFMLYGPNAGVRAGSFHTWVEIFSRYICNLITRTIESRSAAIEVRRKAYQDYNDRLDDEMREMLWEEEKGGGGSYYVNEFGRSGVNMPWTLQAFYEMVRAPDFTEFDLTKAS